MGPVFTKDMYDILLRWDALGRSAVAGADSGCLREEVLSVVRETPGCCIRSVAERLSVDWSTAEYHLRILSRKGLLVERTTPGRRLFFTPAAAPDTQDPAILSEACKRVLDAVIEEGTATASELAASLSLARTGVLRHISTLVDQGFITRQRAGRKVLFLPEDTVVQEPTGPETAEDPADPVFPAPEHRDGHMAL